MLRTMIWNVARSVGELPGDEDAAFAADLHADKALVKPWNGATNTLMKWEGLRIAELGFTIIAQHWLSVLVLHRRPRMVARGVKLDAIGSPVAGVEDLVLLVRLGQSTCADLDILVAQSNREDRLLNPLMLRNTGGRFDECCDYRGGCR